MIIFKKDHISIAYYEADQLLEVTWHAYAASSAYREAMLQYIEALKKYEVRRWLGDYRQSRVVRLADQEWVMEEWAPLFYAHTFKLEKMARIRSSDISARISSENMLRNVNLHALSYTFREFEEYGEARNWLLN